MDTHTLLVLYFDFYGLLLTEKQQHIFKMYYEDDLSLAEIGGEVGVTRQAVHDILQRSEKQLLNYENKLGLVHKFLRQREKIASAYELLKDNDQDGNVSKATIILKEAILEETGFDE